METKKPNNQTNKICSVCNKPYEYGLSVHYAPDGTQTCSHDSDIKRDPKAGLRRENRTRSMDAQRLAAQHRASMPTEETVIVKDPEGKRPPQAVPKKMVENLTKKYEETL